MIIKKPLVSVIMNCYNSSHFLKHALLSVINQTYSNWEIIFWDNQSTDNSADILKEFNDTRIKYFFSNSHTKLYEARNLSLSKCSGELIAFLDCDDIWMSNKLELQVSKFDNNIKFVFGNYDVIDEEGSIIKSSFQKLFHGRVTNQLFLNNFISIGSVIVKKEFISDNLFDYDFNLLGDFELWIRMSMKTDFFLVDSIVELSRIHQNNTSLTSYSDWIVEKRLFYKKYLSLFNIVKYPYILVYIFKAELRNIIDKF